MSTPDIHVTIKPSLNLDSSFLAPAVAGCHHIRIAFHGVGAAAGSTIQFDRNGMSPTEYGDIGISTMMFFAPQPATFTQVATATDRHLYSIDVAGYTGPTLRLVLMGPLLHPTGARLLVLDAAGHITNIYAMQLG